MSEIRTQPPKVSILIPVYNRETLIGECIQSALDQTFTDFEIIIADNASTDGTWEVCRQYAAKDKRIRLFRNDTNIGPVRNWLRCVSEARGEFGKILFSDDLMLPHFLERTLPYLEDRDVAFVSTAVLIGADPSDVFVMYKNPLESVRISSNQYFDFLIPKQRFRNTQFQIPYSPGAAIFRMTDIHTNLLLSIPTKVPRDFAKNGAGPDILVYALTALNYKTVVMLPDAEMFFRAHAGSLAMQNSDNAVVDGYYAAMSWFCKTQLTQHHWARYVARSWMIDIMTSRKLLSLSKYCITFEGSGSLTEILSISWFALLEAIAFVARQLTRLIQI
jgi:glycosyltransferase involved in cell wall biosynthesis